MYQSHVIIHYCVICIMTWVYLDIIHMSISVYMSHHTYRQQQVIFDNNISLNGEVSKVTCSFAAKQKKREKLGKQCTL